MPSERVEADLKSGALVEVKLSEAPVGGFVMPWYAAHRPDTPPGPAGRWLIDRLKDTAAQCPSQG
jgi:DNA-binding transcriptional LysR family regulator